MTEELWKDIPEYEGYYQVSNLGRIKALSIPVKSCYGSKRVKSERVLKLVIDNKGYPSFRPHKEGVGKTVRVHRLVAETFIPNPLNKPFVDHINTIRSDNRVDNLRWVTAKENSLNEISHKKTIQRVQSEEFRKRARENHLGEKNPMFGRLGYKNHNFGRKLSSEERLQLSIKCNHIKRKVVQLTLDGDVIEIFDSMIDAYKKTKARTGNISKCCNGKAKTAKGFKWKYYETS